ncbi:hypothetical protein [Yoonia sp.]|uniref:hypothetical protein n=1 Tax=Yoonia sp. TaxID=2212373 RepID=UPI002FD89B87
MNIDFQKHTITDLGRKLAHIEGVTGAYLPSHVFDSKELERTIDTTKFSVSRMKTGQRKAANWELARFVDLFDLARFGFDYRLFLLEFPEFCAALKAAGVGSYGASVAEHLRETLREGVPQGGKILIRTDMRLSVGGIGFEDDGPRLPSFRWGARVTLQIALAPLKEAGHYLLLLHDFPAGRSMGSLMPSRYAPDHRITGQTLILPQLLSNEESFFVGGKPGYRCLYGIQSPFDLAALLGFEDASAHVPELTSRQVTVLLEVLRNLPAEHRAAIRINFGEYLLD